MAPKTQNGVKEKTSEVKDERVRLRCACGAVVMGRRGKSGPCPKCGKHIVIPAEVDGSKAPSPTPQTTQVVSSGTGLAWWFKASMAVIVIVAVGGFAFYLGRESHTENEPAATQTAVAVAVTKEKMPPTEEEPSGKGERNPPVKAEEIQEENEQEKDSSQTGSEPRKPTRPHKHERLRGIVREALQALESVDDPSSVETWAIVIVREQATAGDFSGAAQTVALLQENGMVKKKKERATLAISYVHMERGELNRALQVGADVVRSLDLYAFWATLASKYALQGDVRKASKCTLEITDPKERATTRELIGIRLAQGGHFEEAKRFAQGLSEPERSNDYCYIAEELGEAGRLSEALQAIQKVKDWKKFTSLLAIARDQSSASDLVRVLELARAEIGVSTPGGDKAWYYYLGIASSYAEHGQEERALELLEFLYRSDIVVGQGYASGLATSFAKGRLWPRAFECAAVIENDRERADSLDLIAVEIAKAGDPTSARKTWDKAREVAKGIRDRKERNECLRWIATSQAENGYIEEALDTLAREEADDRGMHVLAFSDIVESLIKMRRIDQAKKRWQEARRLAPPNHESLVHGDIEELLVATGNLELALELAREARSADAKVIGYMGILEGLNRPPVPRLAIVDIPQRRGILAAMDREPAIADGVQESQVHDSFKVGDYIQNPGFFQIWIGRIVGKKGQTYKVRITYANDGLIRKNPYRDRVGETVDLLPGEFKLMGSPSLDARLKGYK